MAIRRRRKRTNVLHEKPVHFGGDLSSRAVFVLAPWGRSFPVVCQCVSRSQCLSGSGTHRLDGRAGNQCHLQPHSKDSEIFDYAKLIAQWRSPPSLLDLRALLLE
ncbi:hypothetical protein C8F01DRAFT_1254729 [Mycena amicta]|nr:hypothetical protein C8F01DRAFT_1254729 [Mycena amicta]